MYKDENQTVSLFTFKRIELDYFANKTTTTKTT